jgi:ATP-dependent RNA/DNA helicase IGHMBP2
MQVGRAGLPLSRDVCPVSKELVKEYFEHLRKAFQAEADAERQSFEALLSKSGIHELVEKGLAWYPLQIIETGYGYGDYPYVVFERTKHKSAPHSWNPGRPARLYSTAGEGEAFGIVDWVRGDQLKVVFFLNEHPDVLDSPRLAIQQQFDNQSIKTAFEAMEVAEGARNCALSEMRDLLIGLSSPEKPSFQLSHDFSFPLNDSQKLAVELILSNTAVSLVHGPPGTGKTTTLVAAARAMVERGDRVLVCAPSNAAVDHISKALLDAGLWVLRVGNPLRMSESLEAISTEGRLKASPEFAVVKECRKRATEYRRMAQQYKRSFGPQERAQRKALHDEARALMKDALKLEKQLYAELFDKAEVVCATPVAVAQSMPDNQRFDVLLIDEAAQALEPLTWIPLLRADRLVLAGDPFQLPPTVKSESAQKLGLSLTLMEKNLERLPSALLMVQYRMNEAIMSFSNAWFYGGALRADDMVEKAHAGDGFSLEFIDTAGLAWEEQWNELAGSYSNEEEARFLWRRLALMLGEGWLGNRASIALISPYRQQVNCIEALRISNLVIQPQVQTIDAFQGQERDVIMVSLVRCNDKGEIGFLKDYRRMNVAMTRARRKLVIVGDSATLGNDRFYSALIDHCQQMGAYRSAWEFMEY